MDGHEVDALVVALAHGHKKHGVRGGGFTEEDLSAVLEWAAQTRIDAACLRLILGGKVWIYVEDGEPHFTPADKLN